jgi:hypothetical protein
MNRFYQAGLVFPESTLPLHVQSGYSAFAAPAALRAQSKKRRPVWAAVGIRVFIVVLAVSGGVPGRLIVKVSTG